jgi:hypothetical protein
MEGNGNMKPSEMAIDQALEAIHAHLEQWDEWQDLLITRVMLQGYTEKQYAALEKLVQEERFSCLSAGR